MPEQNQKLSLELQLAARLDNEKLQGLVDSDVIFQTIAVNRRVTGKLRGVGEHFLFVENVRILRDYSLTDYLSGKKSIDENVLSEKDFGVYNKRDIAEIYNF